MLLVKTKSKYIYSQNYKYKTMNQAYRNSDHFGRFLQQCQKHPLLVKQEKVWETVCNGTIFEIERHDLKKQ